MSYSLEETNSIVVLCWFSRYFCTVYSLDRTVCVIVSLVLAFVVVVYVHSCEVLVNIFTVSMQNYIFAYASLLLIFVFKSNLDIYKLMGYTHFFNSSVTITIGSLIFCHYFHIQMRVFLLKSMIYMYIAFFMSTTLQKVLPWPYFHIWLLLVFHYNKSMYQDRLKKFFVTLLKFTNCIILKKQTRILIGTLGKKRRNRILPAGECLIKIHIPGVFIKNFCSLEDKNCTSAICLVIVLF